MAIKFAYRSLAAAVFCGAPAAFATNSTDNSSYFGKSVIKTNTTNTSSRKTKVDVQGTSGKMTIFDETLGKSADPNAVVVTMDAIKELDNAGADLGSGTGHSFNTFASQDFTIVASNGTFYGASATKIRFSASLSSSKQADLGTIAVDIYVFEEAGTVSTDTETWSVRPGDIKWDIELASWKFCGSGGVTCGKGANTKIGEMIDFDIEIKGKKTPSEKANKTKDFDLGGATMMLSDRLKIDGNWTSMPTGYPKMTMQGSKTIFTFRFKKFSSSALYDPVIAPEADIAATTSSTGSPSTSSATSSAAPSTGSSTTSSAAPGNGSNSTTSSAAPGNVSNSTPTGSSTTSSVAPSNGSNSTTSSAAPGNGSNSTPSTNDPTSAAYSIGVLSTLLWALSAAALHLLL